MAGHGLRVGRLATRRRGGDRSASWRRVVWVTALTTVLTLPIAGAARAGDELDPSFGTGGKVITHFPLDYARAYATAVAVQSDGKLVAGGTAETWAGPHFAAARYQTNGLLDDTFGSNGRTTHTLGADGEARGMAIQSDGKIVVAGFTFTWGSTTSFDFWLLRLNPDGSPDESFGTAGVVLTDFSGQPDTANAVAVQPDGKIVVAGRSGNNGFALARYNDDGSPDVAFDGDGKVTTFLSGSDEVFDLALQPDGAIIAVGCAACLQFPGGNWGLARYFADGSLDTSFGTAGKVVTDFGGGTGDAARSVVLEPDGTLTVAGVVDVPSSGRGTDFGLVRYADDGSLDESFGTQGIVMTDFGTGDPGDPAFHDVAESLLRLPGGGLVAVGHTSSAGSPLRDFALAAYHSDGAPDSNFGDAGTTTTDFAGRTDHAYAAVLQPDGAIVAAGLTDAQHPEDERFFTEAFALARYGGGSSPPPPTAFTLTVTTAGTGAGSVDSSPAGIHCGTDCDEDYVDGTTVVLTATPDSTSTFTGWSGACSGAGSCTVTMDAAKSVTATFDANTSGGGYTWGGFTGSIAEPPAVNTVRAGGRVKVSFNLGGDHGLDVFETGYPKSVQAPCDASTLATAVDQIVMPRQGLTYSKRSGDYAFVWLTDKAWATTCRQLVLTFDDGSTAWAMFQFR